MCRQKSKSKADERYEQRKSLESVELVEWYRAQLRATLNRSRFNGRIHVIYATDCGYYIRAVVERDDMAERWWYQSGRECWQRNTMSSTPSVPMSKSRAARNAEWNGEKRKWPWD